MKLAELLNERKAVREADSYSRTARTIDSKIQTLNWNTEVV